MTKLMYVRRWMQLGGLGALAALCVFTASAQTESADIRITAVQGTAMYSTDHEHWLPLQADYVLGPGAILKTERDSTVDLILKQSSTVLRMMPETVLESTKMERTIAGEQIITETSLALKSGGIVGSQRKLARPSQFDIALPGGMATIRGTEYVIRADGAVSCLTGEVSVNYNLPGNGGSVKVEVPAGFSFDPATGKVVATTAAFLANLIQDIKTVRENAQTFKVGRATLVVKADDDEVSPTKGHGNNGVGNGDDPQPPGNPPPNDGPGTGPGNPGNKGGKGGKGK